MLMLQLFVVPGRSACFGAFRAACLFRRVPGCLLLRRSRPGLLRAASALLRTKIIANCIFYASHDNFMQKLGLTASEPVVLI